MTTAVNAVALKVEQGVLEAECVYAPTTSLVLTNVPQISDRSRHCYRAIHIPRLDGSSPRHPRPNKRRPPIERFSAVAGETVTGSFRDQLLTRPLKGIIRHAIAICQNVLATIWHPRHVADPPAVPAKELSSQLAMISDSITEPPPASLALRSRSTIDRTPDRPLEPVQYA